MKEEIKFLILADPHFGHNKIKEICQRPDDYNEQLLFNVGKYTHHNSVLILLGDFSFYNHDLWVSRFMDALKGKCWLIRGNHDRKSNSWYLKNGFDCIADTLSLKAHGKNLLFSHKPIYDLDEDTINIHGHLHANPHHPEYDNKTSANHILVCAEHDYKPIPLRDLL